MDHRAVLPVGQLLADGYLISGTLGAGGFGITYEATDVHLGTSVAIKEYFPWEYAARGNTQDVRPHSERVAPIFSWGLRGFIEEARTLARFRHPGIVRVYRVFEANATAYMVMELEKGQSFEQWLSELGRKPSYDELMKVLPPLLDAIECLHASDFVHRDISPDNIILRPDLSPVLLDFGAARKVIAAKTKALTGLVKQGYSPQEQYSTEGKFQGPWTDCYALGATLYRALVGVPPREATDRGVEDDLVPIQQALQDRYPVPFLQAIDKCLAVKIGDRARSIAEVRTLMFPPLVERRPAAVARLKQMKEVEPTRLLPTTLIDSRPTVSLELQVPDPQGRDQVSFAVRFAMFFLALLLAVAGFVIAAAHAATNSTSLVVLAAAVIAVAVYLLRKGVRQARRD